MEPFYVYMYLAPSLPYERKEKENADTFCHIQGKSLTHTHTWQKYIIVTLLTTLTALVYHAKRV